MRIAQRDGIEKTNYEVSELANSTGQDNVLGEFEGRIPVPMQYPGEEYGTRRPWFYSES